ncbi:MAG: cytochrome c oxidase subunit 4 [Burkholderiaceae bacterium]|nr:cytochrome c oxidase subunit 4 [Microbacteriaceae bacterium]
MDDGDPEVGFYSPWSWWPILLAGAISVVFLGTAISRWIALIGVPIVFMTLVGWTFEYYRGYFAT